MLSQFFSPFFFFISSPHFLFLSLFAVLHSPFFGVLPPFHSGNCNVQFFCTLLSLKSDFLVCSPSTVDEADPDREEIVLTPPPPTPPPAVPPTHRNATEELHSSGKENFDIYYFFAVYQYQFFLWKLYPDLDLDLH